MGANQKQLTLIDDDIAFLELGASLAQALDFPAFENEACLEFLFDVVIESGLAVYRNRVRVIWFPFLGHDSGAAGRAVRRSGTGA